MGGGRALIHVLFRLRLRCFVRAADQRRFSRRKDVPFGTDPFGKEVYC